MKRKKEYDEDWVRRVFVYKCACGSFHVESSRIHLPIAYVLSEYLSMNELVELSIFLMDKQETLEEIE